MGESDDDDDADMGTETAEPETSSKFMYYIIRIPKKGKIPNRNLKEL